MIKVLVQYVTFVYWLLRKGKLPSTSHDFTHQRSIFLSNFPDCFPRSYTIQRNIPRGRQSTLKIMAGQLAFLKSEIKRKGGHLLLLQANLSYIRIPKSASTSVSASMLKEMYPMLQNKPLTARQINFLTDANLIHTVSLPTSTVFFTIVRNPFARLVSVYREFFENKNSHFLYDDYLFGILTPHLTFAEFIHRLEIIPETLKDQHLKPQHCFLTYYEKKNIPVVLLKLEDLPSIKAFFEKYGLQLSHLNKSETDYPYQPYYTPKLVEKVFSLYRTDIEKFGYQSVYSSLLTSKNLVT